MFQKKLQQQLQQLLSELNINKRSESDRTAEENVFIKCSHNFFGKVQNSIFFLKQRIASHLIKIQQKNQSHIISEQQALYHKLLRNKIRVLKNETSVVLQENILTLYIELNELKEHANSCEFTQQTEDLLLLIIHEMEPLLRQYFSYQEYQRKMNKSIKSKKSNQCSLKTIPTINFQSSSESLQNTIDESLIEEISQAIMKTPLTDLFQQEIWNEEIKMNESLQICRICFQQVKMMDMKKHVNNCAKKNNLKLELELKNQEIKSVEDQLRQKYQQSCQESIHEQIDEEFRMICKLVFSSTNNGDRRINRRCSMIGMRSEKKICQRIEQYIEDYLEEFGSNLMLQELLSKYRERDLIEKKLANHEKNSLFSIHSFESEENKEDCRKTVRRSTKKSRTVFGGEITPVSEPMKSLFFQKHESLKDQNSELEKNIDVKSLSDEEPKEEQDEEEQTFGALIRKIKTKRSLSKKHEKQCDSEMQWDVNVVKHYSSLHNMTSYKEKQDDDKIKSNVSLKDFDILKFLGQGAFGKVYMVRRKETKDIYALKFIKLSENYSEKDLLAIKNQHQIFKKIAGDHLVKAPFAFSQNSCHIFVLEFLPGGDLRKLLTEEVYFEEDKAAFYLAEIILAIEHLHKYEIIHRDLKPENLVIDKKGHLKLTDFGLSEFQVSKKLNQSRTQEANALEEARLHKSRRRRAAVCGVHRQKMNLIGTPDYIAPEIINQTSFSNYTIDWWSLGVMAYELIIGTRPFCADTIDQVIDNITNFNIEWPEVGNEEGMITPQAKDFIQKLLNKDFTQRLGVNGAQQLKNHPFMAGIDWDKVKSSATVFLPRKMTKLSDIMTMEEDKDLRSEIEDFIGGELGGKKVKNLQLSSFIRFDLLKSQTLENIEKKQEQTNKKLKRLRTLKDISNQLRIQDTE